MQPDNGDLTVSFESKEDQVQNKLVEIANGDEKTVGFYQNIMKADPVVGWFVCTEGPERGRDYRLHSGRNFAGRSYDVDVSIIDDSAVSRKNHCSIVYEPRNCDYILVAGEGTNTYVNELPLIDPIYLNNGDTIKIGDSIFVFIAFCTEERTWM